MKTETTLNTTESSVTFNARLELFFRRQLAMFKYAFAIDSAFIHMVFAGIMFGFLFFTDKTHYLIGYTSFYHWGLLIGAGVQTLRACQHSLTPAAILLLVGFGGQSFLHDYLTMYLSLTYLKMIASVGVVGLVVGGFYRLK